MSVLIVIPARYASTRFPGKPLVKLSGTTGTEKTLIERTWDAAKQVQGIDRIVISTDDDRIKTFVQSFGAEVVMTSDSCRNGTERCAETIQGLEQDYDVVVNLQGDAPLIPHWFVDDVVDALKTNPSVAMATPVLQCDMDTLNGLLNDRKHGRVGGTTAVFDGKNHALYFSKEVIPHIAFDVFDGDETPVYHHVGMYAYRPDALRSYAELEQGSLEKQEGLEQLRFVENGLTVLCVQVEARGRKFWELNNPEDIPVIEAMLQDMNYD